MEKERKLNDSFYLVVAGCFAVVMFLSSAVAMLLMVWLFPEICG
jgi:hypothetical protein